MCLAQPGELSVELGDVLRRGKAILGAEEAEERAGELRGEADQRDEAHRILGRRAADHACAVAVDRRLELQATGREEGLAPA